MTEQSVLDFIWDGSAQVHESASIQLISLSRSIMAQLVGRMQGLGSSRLPHADRLAIVKHFICDTAHTTVKASREPEQWIRFAVHRRCCVIILEHSPLILRSGNISQPVSNTVGLPWILLRRGSTNHVGSNQRWMKADHT